MDYIQELKNASVSLVTKLIEYKFRSGITHEELGKKIKIGKVYCCQIINRKCQPSPGALFRIKELIQSLEYQTEKPIKISENPLKRMKNKAIHDEKEERNNKAKIDHGISPKLAINAKVKDKLLDKVAHKTPPKGTTNNIVNKK